MAKIISSIVACVLVWLAFMWGFWSLWCWVLPQIYTGGPTKVVAPGFWLFVACLTLVSWIGKLIFGDRSKK